MRNLKKILALVLALVMSLSLMATAGATDFKDDGDISDTYRQAAQVLFELGVFNGDQNGQFNPDQPIARSEVAAILYRIATGDIGLEGNKTYAPYNQFPDVTAEDWYAGYVTYCANAGYIKGRNTGKFDAKDDVTGYEVLAMILRAVGYDKNNEFVGSNWQEHTASLATQKGVLVNVLEDPNVRLSQPATREVVAELLFRASLLPQVTYNAATLSYVEDGETLAKANLGMERIEGVVVANEWADLRYDYIDADEDETVLETADGERTLAVPTDLTDIGESRYAYVVGTKVLGQLEDTGKNIVADCADLETPGKATSVSALAGSSISVTKDTEYFYNFSDRPTDTSAYRIEYSISFRTDAAKEWFETEYLYQSANADPRDYDLEDSADWENNYYGRSTVNQLNDTGAGTYYADANGDKIDLVDSNGEAGSDGNADYPEGRTFSRVIPAGETITQLDKDIMNGIFSSAASFDSAHKDFDGLSKDIVHAGYVYAGTKSNPDTADGKNDLSDGMTYAQFAEQYIGTDATVLFNASTNGGWLKIIDNDGDGKAEYALRTGYYLLEVDDYNDRTGTYFFSNDWGDTDEDYLLRDEEYEFAVGDMLLCAWIDGQWVIEEAESEVLTVEKYSWKDVTVTTTDGRVLSGSGSDVYNGTEYDDVLANIPYNTQYEVFYDHYGFIRAFRALDSDRHYGLLTDLYLTDQRNTHYIDNQIATVELSFVDENGKLDMDEYDVSNHSKTAPNVFVGVNQYVNTDGTDTDNLQRAMAHLGMTGTNTTGWWTDGRTSGNVYKGSSLGWEFDYDHDTDSVKATQSGTVGTNVKTNITYSTTNVARYTFNEDETVALSTVSEFAYDKAGNQLFYWNGDPTDVDTDAYNAVVGGTRMTLAQWAAAYKAEQNCSSSDAADAAEDNTVPVYAVDYVMLDTAVFDASNGIDSNSYRFKIDDSYNDGTIDDGRNAGNLNNWHVNTVNDTVFYIVTPSGVYPFVGYRNLPTISGADGNITAAYAVAQNVTNDNAGSDYWVADVVVIELEKNLQGVYSHMIYNVYDNYRAGQKGIIHELNAIDCVTGDVVSVIVDSAWNQAYPTGFYLLSGAEVASDGSITAEGMVSVESRITNEKGEYTGAYADYGIYAGEIVRSSNVEDRGSYIEVFDSKDDHNENGDERYVPLNGAPWYSVYATSSAEANKAAGRLYTERLVNKDYNEVKPNGHEVVYVTDSRGNVVFLIDTSFVGGSYWYTPLYLNEGIRYKSDKITKEYDDAGVYNVGMTQQSNGVSADFIVTVNCIDENGKIVKSTPLGASKGGYVLIKTADTTVSGYTSGTVKNVTTGETISSTSTINDVTGYLVSDINKNMTVTVALTKATLTVALTSSTGTIALKVNDTTVTPAPTTGDTTDVVIGDEFEYTVTGLNNVTNQYELTSTPTAFKEDVEVTWTSTTTATIKGTMKGDNVSLTLTASPRDTVTVGKGTVAAGATLAFVTETYDGNPITTTGDVYKGTEVEFTIVLDTNTGIDKVTYTVGAGTPVDITETGTYNSTDDEYTFKVPGTAVELMPITIDVSTTSTADLAVTFDDQTTSVEMYMTDPTVESDVWDALDDVDVPYDFAGIIKIQAMSPVVLSSPNASKAKVRNPSGDFKNWEIYDIKDDVQITISDPAAATGLTISVASSGGAVTVSGAEEGTTLMYYVTSDQQSPDISGVEQAMTQAEVESALGALTAVSASGLVLTNTAAPSDEFLVIVAFNQAGLVVQAGKTSTAVGTITP